MGYPQMQKVPAQKLRNFVARVRFVIENWNNRWVRFEFAQCWFLLHGSGSYTSFQFSNL